MPPAAVVAQRPGLAVEFPRPKKPFRPIEVARRDRSHVPTELLAYVGAAAMVVIAFVAYRYWRSTATYARQVRESHARQRLESYRTSSLLPPPDPVTEPPHPADDGSDSPPDQSEDGSAAEAVEKTSPVEPGELAAEEFSGDEEPSEDPADLAGPHDHNLPGRVLNLDLADPAINDLLNVVSRLGAVICCFSNQM